MIERSRARTFLDLFAQALVETSETALNLTQMKELLVV